MYAGTVSGGDEGTETASGDDKGLYPKSKLVSSAIIWKL